MTRGSPGTGERVGRYRIVRRIGRGGMATVYLAELEGPSGFHKRVALKLPLEHLLDDERARQMFVDEATLAAQLGHRNVASILELGRWYDRHYIAMELVHGETLRSLLDGLHERGSRIPPELAVHVAAEIAAGLHHAHTAKGPDGAPLGLVHRDVNPSNVIVSTQGDVKIVDFGIAQAERRLARTTGQVLRGKVVYMAPEQANLERVGPSTDQFALGLVLYEMLTGQVFYEGDHALEVLDRARAADTSRVRHAHLPSVPRPIVERMLARDPEGRFRDCAEVERALRAALGELAPGRSDQALSSALGDIVVVPPTDPDPDERPSLDAEKLGAADTRPMSMPTPRGDATPAPAPRPRWLAAAVGLGLLMGAMGALWLVTDPGDDVVQDESPGTGPVVAQGESAELVLAAWTDETDAGALDGVTRLVPLRLAHRLAAAEPLELRRSPGEASWHLEGSARLEGEGTVLSATLRAPGGRRVRRFEASASRARVPQAADELARQVAEAFRTTVTEPWHQPMPTDAAVEYAVAIDQLRGQAYEARQLFRSLAQRHPSVEEAYLWAAMIAWWSGPSQAPWLDELVVMAERAGASAATQQLLAVMRGFLVDGHEPWRSQARALGAAHPDHPFALLVAGEAEVHAGDPGVGAEGLLDVLRIEPMLGMAEYHPWRFAQLEGDAEVLERIARLHPLDDPVRARLELERLIATRHYDEAAERGSRAIESAGEEWHRELAIIRLLTAMVLALTERFDEAHALLREEALVPGSLPRTAQLTGLAMAMLAEDEERRRQWLDQALPGGPDVLGAATYVEGDLRLAVGLRVMELVSSEDGTAWRDVAARVVDQAGDLSSRDQELVDAMRALEAHRADDPDALAALAESEDTAVGALADGLRAELGDRADEAATAYRRGLRDPTRGRVSWLLSHSLARLGRTRGEPSWVHEGCTEVVRPRVLEEPGLAAIPRCRRWLSVPPSGPVPSGAR